MKIEQFIDKLKSIQKKYPDSDIILEVLDGCFTESIVVETRNTTLFKNGNWTQRPVCVIFEKKGK